VTPPTRNVHAEECLEEPAVVSDPQVKQFVRDDKVLESDRPANQIGRQAHDAAG